MATMQAWETKLAEFLENHPDILEESGESDTDKAFYLSQKLKLHQSYDKLQKMVAFVDLIRELDAMRDLAYSKLIIDESARKLVDGGDFKSDPYLKGVISTIVGIKRFIQQRVDDYDDVIEEYNSLSEELD